ncbi:efflux RND transporter periplasmic adaptor subunit [Rhodoferax sp.]|uniref:efflux RND transporter periplasmic adaptor subunit n=1 Tax=Rhodoferax sp. TaxID=50421 RepID=UPI00274D3827|nr:efflux RND transporter periplasmic adaptor subunit [Rhodoferax sp.]
MHSQSFGGLVTLLASASLLVACSRPAPAPEPVRAVRIMTVSVGGIETGSEFAGEVRARVESRLGFRVAGKLVKRQAEVGQRVKAGQLLAQLDVQDYKLAADSARAQVAAASTNRDLAAADFRRFKDLREQNFISGAELERREATLKAAQAQLEQAQAQLSAQGNQTAYTNLVADVAGVVTSVDAEQGQVVAAGTPVVRIAQDGVRDVVFAVPEDQVAAMTVGSKVVVRPWAQGVAWQAQVREVAASTDPVTRTFAVKASLDDQQSPALGTTVSVAPQDLSRAGVPVVKLPTSALRKDGSASAVWVLDPASMTLRSQAVQIATADGNEVVIGSGLTPGMLVVSAGVHVLTGGQKVTVYQERPTSPAAGAPPLAIRSAATLAVVPAVGSPAPAAK